MNCINCGVDTEKTAVCIFCQDPFDSTAAYQSAGGRHVPLRDGWLQFGAAAMKAIQERGGKCGDPENYTEIVIFLCDWRKIISEYIYSGMPAAIAGSEIYQYMLGKEIRVKREAEVRVLRKAKKDVD